MTNLKERNIKRRLVIKRRNIKNKLEMLKHGHMVQQEIFSPITKHLQNIENKIDTKNVTYQPLSPIDKSHEKKLVKQEELTPSAEEVDWENEDYNDYGDDNDNENDLVEELSDEKRSLLHTISTTSDTDTDDNDNRDQYGSLPKKYISDLLNTEKQREFDQKYGVRTTKNGEKLFIGDSRMEIDGSDIIIKNRRYKGTPGLYELLFKKYPQNYTQKDKETYRQIVLKTNAARRRYKPNEQISGCNLDKYKHVIAPIAVSKTTGKGIFMESNTNKTDYIYWDDPNELVERLRLLLSSQNAGHTGHTNEIISIIEELKEAKIIE